MNKKIKETCSCGAVLEYEIIVSGANADDLRNRQYDFQKAHAVCREPKGHQQ
jgi:hypothetical protein